jgi:uncharacterized protein YcbK (DUF882 family)
MDAAQVPARNRLSRIICSLAVACGAFVSGTTGLQNAVANGDTRTISLVHLNSHESLTVTFRRDGRYDRDGLKQLNWFLRDWRTQDMTTMDPKLFDILWAVERESGSRGPIQVLSAYRSPNTNAMLRRRSRAVAEHSQHMLGRAIDFNLPDVPMNKVRAIGMRLQRGGVGYYPNVPFVHLDTGNVRAWPRMPRVELARLFPDGRTVHLPADGKPLPGYDVAKAQILARGDAVGGERYAVASNSSSGGGRSFLARLFGGGDDEDEAPEAPVTQVASARTGDDAGTRRFFLRQSPAARSGPVEAQPAARQPAPVAVASLADTTPAAPAQLPVPRPADLLPAAAPASEAAEAAPAVAALMPKLMLMPLPPPRPQDTQVARLVDVPAPPVRPAVVASLAPMAPSAPAVAAPPPPPQTAEKAPASPQSMEALVALAATAPAQPKRSLSPTAPVVAALSYAPAHAGPPARPAAPGQAQAQATSQVSNPPESAARRGAAANPLQPLFRAEVTGVRPAQRPNVVVAQARLVAVADRPVAQAPRQVVASSFAKSASPDLSFGAFTGPAVKPLPTLQFSSR